MPQNSPAWYEAGCGERLTTIALEMFKSCTDSIKVQEIQEFEKENSRVRFTSAIVDFSFEVVSEQARLLCIYLEIEPVDGGFVAAVTPFRILNRGPMYARSSASTTLI